MIAAAVALAAAVPLACGAVTRPGVAERGGDGLWKGRAVDLCRAVAEQAAGPGAPIAFHSYDDAAAMRRAADDRVAFVSHEEMAIASRLRAGATLTTDRQVLIVKTGSPIGHARDLGGKLVCFIVGTPAEDALDAWAASERVPVERLAFQEPDEMQDAFDVGKCAATATDAAETGGRVGVRSLEPPLAETPILVATPAGASDAWHEMVAAVVARTNRAVR